MYQKKNCMNKYKTFKDIHFEIEIIFTNFNNNKK